jgi:hypothetical protein
MLRSIPTQPTNFCITKIDVPKVRPKDEGYLPESTAGLECKGILNQYRLPADQSDMNTRLKDE